VFRAYGTYKQLTGFSLIDGAIVELPEIHRVNRGLVIIPGMKLGIYSPLEAQTSVIREHVSPLSRSSPYDSEAITPKGVFQPQPTLIFGDEL
jgi:hypothetical protein